MALSAPINDRRYTLVAVKSMAVAGVLGDDMVNLPVTVSR